MMDQCRISLSMLVTSDKPNWTKYQCPFCQWMLHNAVQISCGHWLCHECAQHVLARPPSHCPRDDCAELLTEEDGNAFYPDWFVRKEVSQLVVRCFNHEKGCSWTGPSKELEHHRTSCEHNKVQCKHCASCVPSSSDIGCKQTEEIRRENVSEHLTGDTVQHLNMIANALASEVKALRLDLKCAMEEKKFLKSKIEKQDDAISKLLVRVRQLEEAQQSRSTDLDFRLFSLSNANFDGTMVWKVPNISQRMQDACTGKVTSMISLPFYSGRYGYKMFLSMYIRGNDIGKGTHMSLYIVIKEGKYDSILKWPFTFNVTLRLINQLGGRDVTQHIKPGSPSQNFQKPTSKVNLTMGFPQFIPLVELTSGGFIKDDVMFIKVEVDTSKMTHP